MKRNTLQTKILFLKKVVIFSREEAQFSGSSLYSLGPFRQLSGKESACQARDVSLIPASGRSPGEGNGNPPAPVFLLGKSHGQRNLAGYSPGVAKDSDVIQCLNNQHHSYILCASVALSFRDLQHALPLSTGSSVRGRLLFLQILPSRPASLVIVSPTSQVCNLYNKYVK